MLRERNNTGHPVVGHPITAGSGLPLASSATRCHVRIVVFTANPAIEQSPWWPVLLATPGLDQVLVLRKTWPRNPGAVWRRFRRNVAKHGVLFVPYRLGVLVRSMFHHRSTPPERGCPPPTVPVSQIATTDLHAPHILERVRAWRPDLGASLGAPILKAALFRIPVRGTLNLHLGKLPVFRGAPPAFWELYTGANRIGATVHWVDEGLDTGPVLGSAEAPIYPHDSMRAVEARAAELGCRVLADVLRRLAAGDGSAQPQPGDGRTFRFPTLKQRATLTVRLATRRLRWWLRPRALVKLMAGLAALWVYRPLRDAWRTLAGRHPIRVFTFHRITNLCRDDGMTVSPHVFGRQLEYVRRYHDIVPLEQALEMIAQHRPRRRPAAVLTFDDAYRSVLEMAQPVLAKHGLVACCFASTDLVGTDARFPHDADNPVRPQLDVMTWSDLRRLRAEGWVVGGHGASHRRISECSGDALRHEILGPLEALRNSLGVQHPPMAYPFGGPEDFSPEVRALARASGYSACFSDFGGENFPGDDPFQLKRIDVGANHQTVAWKCWVHGIHFRRRRGRRDAPAAPAEVTPGSQPVRVTHVVFDLDGGGMESLVAGMAKRYVGTDVVLSIVTLSGREGRVGAGIRPLVDQFHLVRQTPGLSMLAPFGLARSIRATRPDVVHLHSGSWYKGSLAARMAGVPRVIYTEHGREHDDPPLARWLDRRAQGRTDVVVAVSERLARYMVVRVGVSSARVRTVQNGVDTHVFTPGRPPSGLRAQLGIPDDAWVLGSVGRLEPVKAYERLIHALPHVRRAGATRPVYVVIFGEGSRRAALCQEAKRMGVADVVRLPGWVDTPVDAYRLLDVFALTSLSEGASLSLMEAMACGIAPVVMDVGANAEILGTALSTQVVPAGDVGAFAHVAYQTLVSESRREHLRSAGRKRVVSCYSFDRMLREYEEIYRGARIAEGLLHRRTSRASAPPLARRARVQ